MSAAGRLQVGILGTGRMARAFATGMLQSKAAELVSVGSRNSEPAERFAAEFGCTAQTGYAAVADDPSVDLVYIATPHSLHSENCLMSLNAGKAVLCEKSFAINAIQAGEVINAARQHELFLMEAMWTRFLPSMIKLRELLESNTIGRPTLLVGGGAFIPDFDPNNYLFRPDLGGGVLLDAGVYLVSLASMLFGTPIRTLSAGSISELGVDDQDSILLQYDDGTTANLYVSLKANAAPEMTIYGELGHIHVHPPIFAPSKLTVKHRGEPARDLDLPFDGNGYHYQVDAAAQCIAAGQLECAVMPLDETLAIMTTMDEIRQQLGLQYPMER